jgi:hypothetical protein
MLLRQDSNLSASARSGSVTPRSAAAAASAAAGQLSQAGSKVEQEHQQQQQQQQQAQWQSSAAASTAGTPATSASLSHMPLSVDTSSPLGSDSAMPAATGPSGGAPPGSLSGWLGGDTSLQKRQQVEQQILHKLQHQDQALSPRQQQQTIPEKSPLQQQQRQVLEHDKQPADQQMSQPLLNLELAPQQQQPQQRRQPRMSCPNPGELLSDMRGGPPQPGVAPVGVPLPLEPHLSTNSSMSADNLATGWAYPSVSADMRRPVSRTSLAQEQLEGLKAIWDLKAKLQIRPDATGSPGSGPLCRDFLQQQQQLTPAESRAQHQQQQQQQQHLQAGQYWPIAENDAAMHI